MKCSSITKFVNICCIFANAVPFYRKAWISAKYDAASGRFRWGDNSYIGYSNWEEGVPRVGKVI